MKILGIDYGRKRIGLAICGPLKIANPLGLIVRSTWEKDLEKFAEYMEDHEISEIVVGLPKNMDNSCGEMAQEASDFAAKLQEHFGIPVVLWDERLTSWQAETLMKDAKMSRAKRLKNRDSIAAMLILQCYVDKKTKA